MGDHYGLRALCRLEQAQGLETVRLASYLDANEFVDSYKHLIE